jgi:tetratricopeptide (TPR) repeat protein
VRAAQGRGGSLGETERLAEEALAIFHRAGDELGEGTALISLASIVWVRGDTARSNELELEALEKLERHPPGEELLNAYTRHAGSASIGGRSPEALDVIEKALALAEQLESDATVARLYQYRGIARSDLGDAGGVDDVRKGLELALDGGDVAAAGVGYSNLASNIYPHSAAEALVVWDEGIEYAAKRGMPGNGFWQSAESTSPLYDLGRWDEVVARATEVAEWASGGGLEYAGAIAATPHAFVLLHRGGPAEASSLLDRWLPVARKAGDPQVLVPALAASAAVAAASGDLRFAVERIRELDERSQQGAALYRPLYLPRLVMIALAAGDSSLADQLLGTTYLAAPRVAYSVAAARAVAAQHNEAFDEALELYEEAASGWSDYGFVLGRAEALEGAGRCLVALGEQQRAAARLEEARTLFAQLGAVDPHAAADEPRAADRAT